MGALYSFVGCFIDCVLKILPVTNIFRQDGAKPIENAPDVGCGNIGISQTRQVQLGSGFDRMICFEFDPDLGSQWSVLLDWVPQYILQFIMHECQ